MFHDGNSLSHLKKPLPGKGMTMRLLRRILLRAPSRMFWKSAELGAVPVKLESHLFDKEMVRYTGKVFGVPTDTLVHYLKINGGVGIACCLIYVFFEGYRLQARCSPVTIGKLGFAAGFTSCAVLMSTLMAVKRRYRISPNAVYNQAIAMALKNPRVVAHLGMYPKTGDFRAYCASGGFKLPMMRRIRSGQYELADLLGTKQRRLRMTFVLRGADGKEGLVSCDVRKRRSGVFGEAVFQSLAVQLTDTMQNTSSLVVIAGTEDDVVLRGNLKF